MNWYTKLASPALLAPMRGRNDPEIPPTGFSRSKKLVEESLDDRIKIFNYVKSKNIKIPMYHGTLMSRYKIAQQTGYLLGASLTKKAPNPWTPKEDQSFVFITSLKEYAQTYSGERQVVQRKVLELLNSCGIDPYAPMREKIKNLPALRKMVSDIETNPNKYQEQGIIITLQMPLYAITEVRDAILGGMKPRTIGDKLGVDFAETPDAIVASLVRQIEHNTYSPIYTSYLGIPLKWATQIDIEGEPLVDLILLELNAHLRNIQSFA